MNVAKLYADALELSPEDYLITALCALCMMLVMVPLVTVLKMQLLAGWYEP